MPGNMSIGKGPKEILGRPPKDKRAQYVSVVNKELDRAEHYAAAGRNRLAKAIRMRIDGDACVRCGNEWKKIIAKNIFAEFEYYMPNCRCYPVCQICGYVMVEEIERDGLSPAHCPNCKE